MNGFFEEIFDLLSLGPLVLIIVGGTHTSAVKINVLQKKSWSN